MRPQHASGAEEHGEPTIGGVTLIYALSSLDAEESLRFEAEGDLVHVTSKQAGTVHRFTWEWAHVAAALAAVGGHQQAPPPAT